MIRYAIADMDGRSHAYFDDRAEAREALREIQIEDSEALGELYLVGYDSNGKRVYGPEAAADALRSKTTLQPSARQWATVETRLVVTSKRRLRYKKPSRSKPFDPCDKLALA